MIHTKVILKTHSSTFYRQRDGISVKKLVPPNISQCLPMSCQTNSEQNYHLKRTLLESFISRSEETWYNKNDTQSLNLFIDTNSDFHLPSKFESILLLRENAMRRYFYHKRFLQFITVYFNTSTYPCLSATFIPTPAKLTQFPYKVFRLPFLHFVLSIQ